ncbi:hypothetical protein [Alkalihalobacillus alcalophilus]|uniref:hypothetical protein n=1 Tax=Alkalihalobacillus alcalophilus TaxID=1445 RepID=UPI00068ED20D|nr:hypothetical protein [Alkalihalobacillus alcalophilus]
MRNSNRNSRKASLQNKNVLLGTMEIANQMSSIAKGLHAKGINGRTLNYYQSYLNYVDDFQLNDFKLPNTTPLRKKIIESLIPNFDIFHFHFSTTLFPDLTDVEILNHLNKPMLMHHWGSEVRDLETAKAVNPYAKIKVNDFSPFKKN